VEAAGHERDDRDPDRGEWGRPLEGADERGERESGGPCDFRESDDDRERPRNVVEADPAIDAPPDDLGETGGEEEEGEESLGNGQ
jgi:hypothetical protein